MTGEVTAESPEELEYQDARSVPVEAPATPGEWDALAGDWESLYQGYYLSSARHAVLECARHLEASVAAGGAETALWALGLYYIGTYVVFASPHAESERRVREVMSGVVRALGDGPCGHPAHPCDDVPDDGHLEGFPAALEMLAHPERDADHEAALAGQLADEDEDDEWRQSWYEGRLTREIWACPRNLAGFARAFLA
ncbi:hypothetical protein [Streptomyces chattanoogensis]|uniref:Uncharacterized protein n=1 Tax=Streptomyces chattanoogensis TaxID=66876 RepID=A0A0N0XZT2_9ACTN|nr:hypothetical protein [Streptomyces chattanoogensis]KPC66818.1 hypothetical protein ADL29_01080 [Streptomyces chattanoogensis]